MQIDRTRVQDGTSVRLTPNAAAPKASPFQMHLRYTQAKGYNLSNGLPFQMHLQIIQAEYLIDALQSLLQKCIDLLALHHRTLSPL
jgi:hypothetical protein